MKRSVLLYGGSLRKQLMYFVGVILLLFILLATTYHTSQYDLVESYDETFGLQEELVGFYQHTHDFHMAYKGYLQTTDTEYFSNYRRCYEQATTNIAKLIGVDSFTFGLLQNMIITYDERVLVAYKEQRTAQKQEHYDYLERLYQLIVDTQTDSYAHLTQLSLEKREQLISSVKQQQIISICVTLLVLLASCILVYFTTRKVIFPLRLLMQNANTLKRGEFQTIPVQGAPEEIQLLSDTFTQMATSIQQYVKHIKNQSILEKRVMEQENENLRMKNTIVETQLNIVQRQMNTHFLFNTLSIISKLAYIEGAEKTGNLMVTTSELLRYSVEKGGKTSTLQEEITSCYNYIHIQKERFGERIQFNIEIENNLPNIRIPAMLIQPLIENAVVHGVINMVTDAKIMVRIHSLSGYLRIIVRDNGVGMDTQTLQDVRLGIGIKNTTERLNILYKENYTFEIISNPNAGTTVTMVLPKEE